VIQSSGDADFSKGVLRGAFFAVARLAFLGPFHSRCGFFFALRAALGRREGSRLAVYFVLRTRGWGGGFCLRRWGLALFDAGRFSFVRKVADRRS
jgi:hypothetical protein